MVYGEAGTYGEDISIEMGIESRLSVMELLSMRCIECCELVCTKIYWHFELNIVKCSGTYTLSSTI
jgi:hypothetical protein